MDRARRTRPDTRTAEIVDLDEALLATFALKTRRELMAEAHLLAQAFSPEGRGEELEAMARALVAGRHTELDRRHARGLAAALRRLARAS
jgi:hypothetical protein